MTEDRFPPEEDVKYGRIYGGVGWPGKRPGFVVMVGELAELAPGLGRYPLLILNEYEADSMIDLVKKCTGFDSYYKPETWLGDSEKTAGREFIFEVNKEFRSPHRRDFRLTHSLLLNMPDFFTYLYNALRRLLDKEKKILTLGAKSRLRADLSMIQPEDIESIKLGQFPSIEALGFAALALEKSQFRDFDNRPRQMVADSDYDILNC